MQERGQLNNGKEIHHEENYRLSLSVAGSDSDSSVSGSHSNQSILPDTEINHRASEK